MSSKFYRKCIYLVIVLTLQLSNSFGQNLQNLDRKFGINKFKLEANLSLYKKELVKELTIDDNVIYYKYTGLDFITLFGIYIHKCVLGFYKDKLYTISIDLGMLNKEDETLVYYKLKQLFGLADLGTGDVPLDYQWQYLWQTSKTYLGLSKYKITSSYNPGSVGIFIYSKKLQKQINDDNF